MLLDHKNIINKSVVVVLFCNYNLDHKKLNL